MLIKNYELSADNKITVPNKLKDQVVEDIDNKYWLEDYDVMIYMILRRWGYLCSNHAMVIEKIKCSGNAYIYEVDGKNVNVNRIRETIYKSPDRHAVKKRSDEIADSIERLNLSGHIYCLHKDTNEIVKYKQKLHNDIIFLMPLETGFTSVSAYRFDALMNYCRETYERTTETFVMLLYVLTFYANLPNKNGLSVNDGCYLSGKMASHFTQSSSQWCRAKDVLASCWVSKEPKRIKNVDDSFSTIQTFKFLPYDSNVPEPECTEEEIVVVEQGAGVSEKPEKPTPPLEEYVPVEEPLLRDTFECDMETVTDMIDNWGYEEQEEEVDEKPDDIQLTDAQLAYFNANNPISPPESLMMFKSKEEKEELIKEWNEKRNELLEQYKKSLAGEKEKTDLQKAREELAAKGLIDEDLINEYNRKQEQKEQERIEREKAREKSRAKAIQQWEREERRDKNSKKQLMFN